MRKPPDEFQEQIHLESYRLLVKRQPRRFDTVADAKLADRLDKTIAPGGTQETERGCHVAGHDTFAGKAQNPTLAVVV